MKLIEAMARMEGFYREGTRPYRLSNPGDLEYGPFAMAHGATGSDGRFAIFPNATAGFAAMRTLLLGKYGQHTIRDMIYAYAPPNENDTERYLKLICEWSGHTPDELVSAAIMHDDQQSA